MLMHFRFTFESLNTLNSPGEYMRYYRQLRGLTTRQLAEKLIADGKYTDAVDEVLLKIIGAKQKKFKVIYKEA